MTEEDKRTQAWIGDAVLALYAREWILQQPGIPREARSDTFKQLTANQFLATIGEPTAVEAEIGRHYQDNGLEAAYAHIEAVLIPQFKKQQANRKRAPGSYRNKSG